MKLKSLYCKIFGKSLYRKIFEYILFTSFYKYIYAVVSCKCTALLLLLQNQFRCFEIKKFTYFEF